MAHILPQNLHSNYKCPEPRYLVMPQLFTVECWVLGPPGRWIKSAEMGHLAERHGPNGRKESLMASSQQHRPDEAKQLWSVEFWNLPSNTQATAAPMA